MMTEPLREELLSRFNDIVAAQLGLHFPRERWRDLERGIRSAAKEFDFQDAGSGIERLLSSPLTKPQIEILASHLTIGETYFLREKQCFQILEERILPELICSRQGIGRHLRIWSAGCCTGEEPYSIAISLEKFRPVLKNWAVTILATDINPRFLQKASDGVYGEWSFRETMPWIKERYFKPHGGGRWRILPAIKQQVTFSYLNLAEDLYPSLTNSTNAMDVIFCRNVLMYFVPERAKRVIRNFYRSLMDGGWLIVSPSETSQALFSQFATVNFPGVILYRKAGGPPAAGPAAEALAHGWTEAPKAFFWPQKTVVPEPVSEAVVPRETGESQAIRPVSYQEAVALYGQGRYAEASEAIAGILSDHPDDAGAMALLARVHANQGRLGEAIEWCRHAIAADKLNAGYHYLLAVILQEDSQAEETVHSLRRALYLDPNFVLAHFTLGNLVRRQGRLKESVKHFENALSLLGACSSDEILPESDAMTAGRLRDIIRVTAFEESVA